MSIEIEKIKKQIFIITTLLKKIRRLYQLLFGKKLLIVHHTATARDYTRFESINRGHKERKYEISELGYYCAYNELITGNGERHYARKESENGQGCSTCPDFHYDLCLTGNFNKEVLSDFQEKTLRNVLNDFKGRGYEIKIHQDYYATDCCGRSLIDFLIQNSYYKKL